jgi:hypothetical protein
MTPEEAEEMLQEAESEQSLQYSIDGKFHRTSSLYHPTSLDQTEMKIFICHQD